MAWKLNVDSNYITDNGAVYCGRHLGASATYTGRDISGQAVLEITKAVMESEEGGMESATCEDCGKSPTEKQSDRPLKI